MNLKNRTTEQLQSKLKKLQIITWLLLSIVTVLIIVTIYGLIKIDYDNPLYPLIGVPLVLSALIPLNLQNIRKIKREIASRRQQ